MKPNDNIHSNEPKYDEKGRLIMNDPSEIPADMTEEETAEFWEKHAMSEELLEKSFIPEDDEDDLPPLKELRHQ